MSAKGGTQKETLFAQTMKRQEEALSYHAETDEYMRKQKKIIILKVLKQIANKPPEYLTQERGKPQDIDDLKRVIRELEKILRTKYQVDIDHI